MAKAKKKSRASKARAKGPDYKGSRGNEQDEKIRLQKIVPVMEQLVSSDMTDRSMAISAINVMCEDPKLRTLLLKEKLLKVVLESSIKDDNEEIVSESYGLLRNLCIEEGYDVAVFLWRQNILSAIEDSLNKISKVFAEISVLAEGGASDSNKFTKQQITTVFEFTENILGLISSLAGSSEEIFSAVSNRLIPGLCLFLLSIIEYARSTVSATSNIAVSSALFTAACEVLYTLSEDNAEFITSVSAYPFEDMLNEFLAGKKYYPSPSLVYVNGLKYNTLLHKLSRKPKNHDSNNDPNDQTSTNTILLEIQTSLIAVIKSIDIQQARKDMEPLSSDASIAEVNKQFIKTIQGRSLIESVQVGIEIITAVAETITVDPTEFVEPDEPLEEDINEEDEAMMVDNDDEDLYIRKAVESHDNEDMDASVFDGEDSETDENMDAVLKCLQSESLPIITELLSLPEFQSRAMAALNNISWSLHTKASGSALWKSNAQELWNNILPNVTASNQSSYSDIEVQNSAIGVLWAVASTFKGEVPISEDAINYLISQTTNLASLFPFEECAEYCVKVVGLLAQLAKASGKQNITSAVAKFYFEALTVAPTKPTKEMSPLLSPKVVIDIVYAIFEVFGDKSYEYDQAVYVDGGLNGKLNASLTPLRKFFKRVDRVKDFQLRARGEECVLNLARFIDYKKQERL